MSDAAEAAPAASRPTTAGGLLRAARQAQGVHIAALAAAIKVTPRKLELLESDQFDQLPDPTFTRALAQAVCRSLKIDAAPVLALLPPPKGHRLEHVAGGLNMPFRDRPGQLVPKEWAGVSPPVLWGAVVIVLLAAAVYALPADWMPFQRSAITRPRAETVAAPAPTVVIPAVADAASGAALSASAAATEPSPAASSAAADSDTAEPGAPDAITLAAASGVLQLHATAATWVEVTDARGQSLISRLLQPGENVGLDGVTPLKLRVGNAVGTQVQFRGQALELAPYTRDNVARLDLK